MAVKIARFNIDFTATSAQLRQVFKQVGTEAQSLGAKIKGSLGKLSLGGLLGMAGGATAGIYAIQRVIRNSMQSLDELGKMSDRLGLDPADLKQLQIAAELGGASIAEVEKGLRYYLRQAYEAANGSKRLAAELNAVGVNLEDLARMSVAEQIAAIGRGLNSLPNPAQRAAIATDLFSRAGLNLLQTLSPAALAQASEQMERMGFAITREDIARVEAANDAWAMMKVSIKQLADAFTMELAPAIKETIELLNLFFSGLPHISGAAQLKQYTYIPMTEHWFKAYMDAAKKTTQAAPGESSVWDAVGVKDLFKEITYELPKRPHGIALAVSDLNLALEELHETLLLLAPGALWQGIQSVIGSVGPALRTIAERAGILPRAAAMALPAGTPAGGAFLAKGTSEAYSASRRSVDSQVANANIRTARNTQATVAAVKALGKLVGVKFRVVDAPHRGQ